MTLDRRFRMVTLAVVLVVSGVLGTILSVSLARRPAGCLSAAATVPRAVDLAPPVAAAMTVTLPAGARGVDPLGLVSVTATTGRLVDVVMINDAGFHIAGIMTPANTMWKPGVPLGYGRTYTLTVTGAGTSGALATRVSRFSTLTPRAPSPPSSDSCARLPRTRT